MSTHWREDSYVHTVDFLRHRLRGLLAGLVVLGASGAAFAQEAAEAAPDSGDTAWMLTATALVLFMTIPGLSLFYGGLVRTKNVLSVLMQCFALTAVVSVLWAIYGYSLAFANMPNQEEGVINLASLVGGFGKLFLAGVAPSSLSGTFPESIFVVFQMTFAIITPALIVGAYAERMKFSAVLLFSILWLTLVYAPICHMAWSGPGSLFHTWGVIDFAGGTVVHINAGIAALVSALIIGKRRGYPERMMLPHNLTMTVTGAGLLWVGWFGFNAGSALSAGGAAGMAMLVTQLSTAMAAVTWMAIEWFKHGKPSALGLVTGAVAGLVAITPASGNVGPMGALAIGIAAGIFCYLGATWLKHAFGYDDSLDAFGVHGVGGFVGAVLSGVFCAPALGGLGFGPGHESIGTQVVAQLMSCGVTIVWSGVVSLILFKLIDVTIGLRVSTEDEEKGLDLVLHNEEGYNY
ncbi:MAG: ammonium transporter [Candidatus Hydrogenedentes bacterium]|nr:ammonium transporter [Candidatus Hydrogenedentota bacterium]